VFIFVLVANKPNPLVGLVER